MDSSAMVFMADHKGKCAYCEGIKPLDEMLADHDVRGSYHCVDCEVQNYGSIFELLRSELREGRKILKDRKGNKLDRLIVWAFG
jgi:hypothetical protein